MTGNKQPTFHQKPGLYCQDTEYTCGTNPLHPTNLGFPLPPSLLAGTSTAKPPSKPNLSLLYAKVPVSECVTAAIG